MQAKRKQIRHPCNIFPKTIRLSYSLRTRHISAGPTQSMPSPVIPIAYQKNRTVFDHSSDFLFFFPLQHIFQNCPQPFAVPCRIVIFCPKLNLKNSSATLINFSQNQAQCRKNPSNPSVVQCLNSEQTLFSVLMK